MNPQRAHLLFRAESVSRSLSFYIPATVIARALGLARGVILARLISEHEFGLFQVTLLVVNVLNPLCGLGLNEGVARYVPMYETRGRLRTYLRRAVPFVALVALLLSAVVFVAAQPVGKVIYETLPQAGAPGEAADPASAVQVVASEDWTALTRIAAGVTFGTVMYFLVLAILKGMRMFRAVSLLELLNNLLFTGLTVVAALAGWQSAAAMMGGYGLTLLVLLPLFAIPMWRSIQNEPRPNPQDPPLPEPPLPVDDSAMIEAQMLGSHSHSARTRNVREPREWAAVGPGRDSPLLQLMRFSAWAAVAAVIWQVLQYYPMWFLQKTHGPSVTAVFGGVRLITQVVLVGAITIIAVVQTSVNKQWESQGHAEADRRLGLAYKSTSLLMLVGCVLFSLAAGPIMRMFPASFAIGVPVVPLSLMFFLISAHLTFLAIHFALIEKMRHLFWPWTLGLACNVLFALWFVSPHAAAAEALVAAAWAGNLAITAALVAAVALLRFERRPIDAGMVMFWMAIYILALPAAMQTAALLGVVVLAVASGRVFSVAEKREMLAQARHLGQIVRQVTGRAGTPGGRP